MQTAGIVLEKILFVGVMIAAGFLCGKLGVINRETNRKASELLLLVISPCLILTSYQVDFSPALLHNLLLAFGLSAICFAIHLLCAYVFIRPNRPDAEVERMSVIFSNCMFLGIPLVQALYGPEGVLYLTAYVTGFNLLFWTQGVILMSGRGDWRLMLKKLCSPALLSIAVGLTLFLLRVRLPELVRAPLAAISDMNTPLAMLIAGATIAETDMKSCLLQPRIYRVVLLKMIAVPALAELALCFLPVEPILLLSLILAAACPTASYCTMFAHRYGKNSGYAAQIFTLTTISSLVMLPLVVLTADLLL